MDNDTDEVVAPTVRSRGERNGAVGVYGIRAGGRAIQNEGVLVAGQRAIFRAGDGAGKITRSIEGE